MHFITCKLKNNKRFILTILNNRLYLKMFIIKMYWKNKNILKYFKKWCQNKFLTFEYIYNILNKNLFGGAKMAKTVYLTHEGYEDLKKELDDLINVKRPANIKAIKEARALGDLSENAEYDAARNEQAELEGRIQKIEQIMENVSIIENVDNSKVSIGNTVSIKYIDDAETDEYQIVGSQEADPFQSKISNESPIAQALLNRKVGDIVDVDSPNGIYQVEIIAIK